MNIPSWWLPGEGGEAVSCPHLMPLPDTTLESLTATHLLQPRSSAARELLLHVSGSNKTLYTWTSDAWLMNNTWENHLLSL